MYNQLNAKPWRSKKKITRKVPDQKFHPYIPEEIVLNMLPKLPVDSLHRFRCVSKQWSLWISTLRVQKQKILVRSVSYYGDNVTFQTIDQAGSIEPLRVPWEESESVHVFGYCNGIFLIGTHYQLYLWNPNIDSCSSVAPLELCFANRWPRPETEHHIDIDCGLCYDSYHNDYKIVTCHRGYRNQGSIDVVVGSCKRSNWTEISLPYVDIVYSGPALHNQLHWVVNTHSSFNFGVIVYFNPMINKFLELPIPTPKTAEGDIVLGLGVIHGCLCMTRRDKTRVEVLQMKEYGVKETWSLLFRVEQDAFGDKVHGLVPLLDTKGPKSEVLMTMVILDSYGIIWVTVYDKNSSRQRYVMSLENYSDAIVYEETLVRPSGYNRGESDRESSSKEDDDEYFRCCASVQDLIERNLEKKVKRKNFR